MPKGDSGFRADSTIVGRDTDHDVSIDDVGCKLRQAENVLVDGVSIKFCQALKVGHRGEQRDVSDSIVVGCAGHANVPAAGLSDHAGLSRSDLVEYERQPRAKPPKHFRIAAS